MSSAVPLVIRWHEVRLGLKKASAEDTCRSLRLTLARGQSDRCSITKTLRERFVMLGWSITFLLVALLAGLFGFWGIAGTAAYIAKVLFVIFLVLFLVSLLVGRRTT